MSLHIATHFANIIAICAIPFNMSYDKKCLKCPLNQSIYIIYNYFFNDITDNKKGIIFALLLVKMEV